MVWGKGYGNVYLFRRLRRMLCNFVAVYLMVNFIKQLNKFALANYKQINNKSGIFLFMVRYMFNELFKEKILSEK